MVIFKSIHIDALQKNAIRKFETEMMTHFHEFNPVLCGILSEEQLRLAIRVGINKASSYGYIQRGAACIFLELIFLFGSSFDTDPQHEWAHGVLKDETIDQNIRKDKLIKLTNQFYLPNILGLQNQYAFDAIERLRSLAETEVWNDSLTDESRFIGIMIEKAAYIHPQKVEYTQRQQLEMLFEYSVKKAREYGASQTREYALFASLMLSFGHGCTNDPLYPWIYNTLNNQKVLTAEARIKKLETKALTWSKHALKLKEEK